MKRNFFIKNFSFFCMVLTNLGLSISVVFLMNHVQDLLNSDAKINMMEVVTQNKSAITSRLMLNLNSLGSVAEKITDSLKNRDITDPEAAKLFIDEYGKHNNTKNLFVANRDGIIIRSNGEPIDISGRQYFKIAMSGVSNVSERTISRMDGEEYFLISVALYYNNEVVGTLQKAYKVEQFLEICALSLFSSQGYMFIINSEGYTILHSVHDNCVVDTDNYLRDLYSNGNSEASDQIRDDIKHKRSGFMQSNNHGVEIFSAYTPIDKIHDWYLITSVPMDAVSQNGNTVINLFYIILIVLVIIFSFSLTYFLWYKNKQREQLEHIAFVDPVTGGNTYTKFLIDAKERLDAMPSASFHVLAFDIDNFKFINNSYGFATGDNLLRQITEHIKGHLSPMECVARVSRDHFVALVNNAEESRIAELLSSHGYVDTFVSFSAGVYHVADPNESITLMVDKASTAARSVKGKLNRMVEYYSLKFEQLTLHNEQMKRAVKRAIENDEFAPYYQPKVNVMNNRLVGCEALVRWKTPDGQFIYPDQFIPLCEQTGLITDIDFIVYEKCLKLLKKFIDQGVECVPISVNFSRLHLQNEGFLDKIVKMREAYGVPACFIEAELTESAIFDNMESIASFTQKMHDNGFLVAMDDFGSGYSSLNMLREIPIDILKIDKGFLAEAQDNARRNIIFSSIVEMARKLHIKVVVEGVEHLENVELMKECGCFVAQGYYFARPMDEESFVPIFRKGSV